MKTRLIWIALLCGSLIVLGVYCTLVAPQAMQTDDYILSHESVFDSKEVVLNGIVGSSGNNEFILLAGSNNIPVIVFVPLEVETPDSGYTVTVKGIFNASAPVSLRGTQIEARHPLMNFVFYLRSIIALPPLVWIFFRRWRFDFQTFSFKRRD
ncbi:MAG: hypothetical protein ACFFCZ_28080 [Promethearchaeota archaeon]